MNGAIIILLGAGFAYFFPGQMVPLLSGGFATGMLTMLFSGKLEKLKAAYIAPLHRPKPTTPRTMYLLAVLTALGGVALGIATWAMPSHASIILKSSGLFISAAGVGTGAMLALGAKRSSEKHNAWLAAMTPQTPLEF